MKTLEAGSKAPEFELPDQNETVVRLKDFRGRRVLLYFYPKAMTPGCTQQACGLRDTLGELQKRGVEVFGISPDPAKRLKKFEEKERLNFSLLADESHAVAEAFGVWGPKTFMGRKYDGVHRISFLIDAKGFVEQVFADFKAKEHHDIVLKYLDT